MIYGGKEPPLPVSVEPLALKRQLATGTLFTTMIELDVGGTPYKVLPRDVQFHPVTDVPEHVDFLRVTADTLITADVPMVFDHAETCPGIKRGGVLNIVRHTIELVCRADAIPHSIHADLADMDIGDSLHISHVKLPPGVKPTITDRDFTIATVAAPTVVRDEALEAAAAAAAAEAAALAAAAEGAVPVEGAPPAEGEGAEGAAEAGEKKPAAVGEKKPAAKAEK